MASSSGCPGETFRPNPARAGGSDPEPWRVLVVDDEPDVFAVLEMAVGGERSRGRVIELEWSASGASARQRLAAGEVFDLLMVDIVMEHASAGLDLIQWVLAEFGDQRPRMVVLTGQPGDVDERLARFLPGVDAFILKTDAEWDRLLAVLDGLLG